MLRGYGDDDDYDNTCNENDEYDDDHDDDACYDDDNDLYCLWWKLPLLSKVWKINRFGRQGMERLPWNPLELIWRWSENEYVDDDDDAEYDGAHDVFDDNNTSNKASCMSLLNLNDL